MGKKRKGGNPKKHNAGGRVTAKGGDICRSRSNHAGRPVRHLFSSHRTLNGVRDTHCSWCGTLAPGSPKHSPMKRGDSDAEVPEEWFSDEDPVCALPIEEWRRVRGKPHLWPQAAQEALLAGLE